MFYLLDKKEGLSSFKAIRDWARENSIKKVGHTGTLDPMATGLLLIATDDDTKLIEYIDKGKKTYIATMKLGYESDTYDTEGEVKKTNIDLKGDVEEALMSFVKTYDQMPPKFSAKKINGKRAYELARNNEEVILKPSTITIHSIKNINKISEDEYSFEVEVSRGTYIRSLIFDVGQKLGCGAIMSALVRSAIGELTLDEKDTQIHSSRLVNLPLIETDNLKDLLDGKSVYSDAKDGIYALVIDKEVIGIVEVKEKAMKSKKLLGNKIGRISNESN